LVEFEAKRERLLLALLEINNKIEETKGQLTGISSEWNTQFASDVDLTSEEDFGGDLGGGFDINIEDPIERNEDNNSNNSSSDTASSNSQPVQRRKRKRMAATSTRKANPRNKGRINYKEGSSSKRRYKKRPVSIYYLNS